MDKSIVSAQGRLKKCLDNDDLRTKEAAFRRQGGRLGAKRLLYIILQSIYKSMQLHLDDFYHKLGEPSVTRQALSKARKNLNPEFVRGFINITAEVEASDKEAETYRGMRVIAVDGSDVALCNSAELKEEFGCSGPAQNAATALASIAFDPFSHVVFDAQMDAYKTDERTLAKRHAERLLELQDFYATVYLANLAAFAVQEADERIQAKDTEKDLKHPRKANRNRTIAKLREVWLCLLLEPDAAVRDTVLKEILSALVRFPVSVVKGRSPQRKKPRNMRFPIAKKSVL